MAAIISSLILVATAWPVMVSCNKIFLQSSPTHLDVADVKEAILAIDGVHGVHEEHFWQLVDGLVIGTIHLLVSKNCNWSEINATVKDILHHHGVHSTTLQPEFVDTPESIGLCEELGSCVPQCRGEKCCKPRRRFTVSQTSDSV
eukprot:m.95738 g.95738  ORF g.95738 m.95738 type:complete len:145 (-) comp12444_c0_seq8:116-550(-)